MKDVEELPPEGEIDREGFLRYGIRAELVWGAVQRKMSGLLYMIFH